MTLVIQLPLTIGPQTEESLCTANVLFLEILLRFLRSFLLIRLDHSDFGHSNLFRVSNSELRIWLRLCRAVVSAALL